MRLRALVVEKDETMREAFTTFLEERGYEVIPCAEPLLCPLYLDHPCPCPEGQQCADVVIAGMESPAMTGLEFLKGQIAHGCKVGADNMAVVSNEFTREQRVQAGNQGFHVFAKPLAMQAFVEWLDECEARRRPDRVLVDLNVFAVSGRGSTG